MAKSTKAEVRQQKFDDARGKIYDGYDQARTILEDLRDEIEEIRESLEEKFSGTTRYEMIEEALTALEELINDSELNISDIDFNW